MNGEEAFIARLAPAGPCAWPLGLGDDGAQLPDGTLVALDTIVEGTHFESGCDPAAVAAKALGACLSDLCALGARGHAVFVSAQLPPGAPLEALADGLVAACARYGVLLGGGDTVATRPGALALAVTALGHLPAGLAAWRRDGARPGDGLWVTGPLGGSRAGRHLDVRPRDDVVSELRGRAEPVHAAMDLSDGLAVDLPRLLAASGVGATIDAAAVPRHADTADAADPLLAALCDGEDFELLLALPAGGRPPRGAVRIGQVGDGPLRLRDADGQRHPWPRGGFQHDL